MFLWSHQGKKLEARLEAELHAAQATVAARRRQEQIAGLEASLEHVLQH